MTQDDCKLADGRASQQLEAARAEERRLLGELSQQTARQASLAQKLETTQAQREELRHRLEAAQAQLEQVHERLARLDGQKAEALSQLGAAQDEAEAAAAKLRTERAAALRERAAAGQTEEKLRRATASRTALALRLAARLWRCKAELKDEREAARCSRDAAGASDSGAPASQDPPCSATPPASAAEAAPKPSESQGPSEAKSPGPQVPASPGAIAELKAKLEWLVHDNAYLRESLRAVRGFVPEEAPDCSGSAQEHADAAGPKETILTRLRRLAEQNSSLREQLAAAEAERQGELRRQPSGDGGGVRSKEAAPQHRVEQPPRPSSAARNEIMSRLAGATSANAELQKVSMDLRKEMAEARVRHEVEISQMRSERDVAARRLSEMAEELRHMRQIISERQLFLSAEGAPSISIVWSDGARERWPGGSASARGANQLRRLMAAKEPELTVGPPPADWRTWLQAALRRGEPVDPAMLRLSDRNSDDGPFIGLMWSAPAA